MYASLDHCMCNSYLDMDLNTRVFANVDRLMNGQLDEQI